MVLHAVRETFVGGGNRQWRCLASFGYFTIPNPVAVRVAKAVRASCATGIGVTRAVITVGVGSPGHCELFPESLQEESSPTVSIVSECCVGFVFRFGWLGTLERARAAEVTADCRSQHSSYSGGIFRGYSVVRPLRA